MRFDVVLVYKQPAHKYEMGVSTLHDAVYKGRKNSAGRDPYLMRPVEDRVAQWLGMMAHIGYGQSKKDVVVKVTYLVMELGLPTPWVGNRPSSKWYFFQHIMTAGHPYIFDDPMHIYETGFSLPPRPPKVLADVTQCHVDQSGYASTKTQITIMLVASPVGHYIWPMVVYAGVQPRNKLRKKFHEMFPEGLFGNRENGWIVSYSSSG